MSYLLTEIALDMLGYKFYDVNGVYHTTDFQSISGPTPENIEEPSLEDVIYPKDQPKLTNGTSTESGTSLQATNLPVPKICINQDQLVMQNIKESIDKEINVLLEKIKKKEDDFTEPYMKPVKNKDKTAKILTKDLPTIFNKDDRELIRKEAKRLTHFLKCVEKSLEEANPEHFKELKGYKIDELL